MGYQNRSIRLLSITVLATVIIGLRPDSGLLYAQVSPHIDIHINTGEVSPGDSVSVDLDLAAGDSVKSIMAILDYDETIYGYIDGSAGKLFRSTSFIDIRSDTIDSDLKVYMVGVTLGSGRYIAAPGQLFNLQFVALTTGTSDFQIDSLVFYDPNLDTISGTSTGLTSVVTPDTFPPDPITDFKLLAGSEEITFSWRNPTDMDFEGTLIIRSEDGFVDTVSSQNTIAYDGPLTSFTDSNLENNTVYYYSAFSYDEIPNYSSPVFINGQPKEELVYAYPNPFNPDNQSVAIKTLFPFNTSMDLSIYDATGNPVIDLIENAQLQANTARIFRWDGKNGDGRTVANGVYYLVVKADQGGNRIEKVAVLR